ncbi:MAG: hypothetical protein VKL42_14090 [Snowella sp.]|nr:hypothetical protein [Snowella sp.]
MNDALERLKNRQRPSVPERSISLDSGSVDTSISRSPEEKNIEFQTDRSKESVLINKSLKEFTTKQSTFRIESKLLDRVAKICAKEGLGREVLFEALFEFYEKNIDVQQSILEQAKEKAEFRQAIANYKRAKTMIDKFG